MRKNIQEALIILNLQAVYVLALFSDDDTNVNIQIMQVLILLVLIYFFIVFFYHCSMSILTCSKVIIRVRNKLAILVKVLRDKILFNKVANDPINIMDVNSHLHTSRNYYELQESLIAIDN